MLGTLRDGAQRLVTEALQAEFVEYVAKFAKRRDGEGRLAVVRNGWQPRPEVLTGLDGGGAEGSAAHRGAGRVPLGASAAVSAPREDCRCGVAVVVEGAKFSNEIEVKMETRVRPKNQSTAAATRLSRILQT